MRRSVGRMQSKFAGPKALVAISAVAALAAAGCGGGGSSKTTAGKPPSSTPATTVKAAAPAPAAKHSSSGLSGTWSGHYGGNFSGSFTLKWTQSGSKLAGTIKLSNPPGTSDINGSVSGSSIKFGTVGSEAITYSGSVSGKSMSGSYHTPQGGGPWSANKS